MYYIVLVVFQYKSFQYICVIDYDSEYLMNDDFIKVIYFMTIIDYTVRVFSIYAARMMSDNSQVPEADSRRSSRSHESIDFT